MDLVVRFYTEHRSNVIHRVFFFFCYNKTRTTLYVQRAYTKFRLQSDICKRQRTFRTLQSFDLLENLRLFRLSTSGNLRWLGAANDPIVCIKVLV